MSENQDGETRREPQGENIGIIAQTSEGVTPAVISIIRSKVTESKQNPKPEGSKPTKAVAASTTKAKTTGVLAATGDTSGAAIVATVLAGTAAIAAGTMASRKRS